MSPTCIFPFNLDIQSTIIDPQYVLPALSLYPTPQYDLSIHYLPTHICTYVHTYIHTYLLTYLNIPLFLWLAYRGGQDLQFPCAFLEIIDPLAPH